VIVVGTCNQLGAVGVWQNISPPAFVQPSNMETLAVVVNPLDQSVYAAAGNKTSGGNSGTGVYKSTDCGATWKLVSTGTQSAKLFTGDPWAMRIDPINPQNLYINNGYGNDPTLYKSSNGGVDWVQLSPDPDNVVDLDFVQAIAIDPENPQHLAVTFHNNCKSPYNGSCFSRTTNGGANWQMFNGPAAVGGWREGASLTILGSSSYLFTCDSGVWFTDNLGQTWSLAIGQGTLGSYGGGAHRGPDGTYYLGIQNSGVYKSVGAPGSPVGKTWSKIPNSFNSSLLTDDGVNLISTFAWNYGGKPFDTAPLNNLSSWSHVNTPSIGRGANMFAHDASHHIIYSANWGAGLWRVVTQ
jgi:hypothetical protein